MEMLVINGNEYFSEKEVSNKYGLSTHWFKKSRYKTNGPKYYKLNRNIYYRLNELDEWFKSHLITIK